MSEEFERRTSDVLHRGVERLDARTLSRLNQARQRALAEVEAQAGSPWRRLFGGGFLLPAGAAAATVIVAITLWSGPRGAETGAPGVARGETPTAFEDLELLADGGDALELVSEGDAAFFEWAEGEIEASSGGSGTALGS